MRFRDHMEDTNTPSGGKPGSYDPYAAIMAESFIGVGSVDDLIYNSDICINHLVESGLKGDSIEYNAVLRAYTRSEVPGFKAGEDKLGLHERAREFLYTVFKAIDTGDDPDDGDSDTAVKNISYGEKRILETIGKLMYGFNESESTDLMRMAVLVYNSTDNHLIRKNAIEKIFESNRSILVNGYSPRATEHGRSSKLGNTLYNACIAGALKDDKNNEVDEEELRLIISYFRMKFPYEDLSSFGFKKSEVVHTVDPDEPVDLEALFAEFED